MKRFTFILVALLTLFPVISEGAGKGGRDNTPAFDYEVRAGWGGMPLYFDGSCRACDVDFYNLTLSEMYGDYTGHVYMTGVISAEFSIFFKKWFSLAFNLGYNGLFTDRYSGLTDEKLRRENGYSLTFMPQARFTYFSRPMVSLYSSVGLGISGMSFMDDKSVDIAGHLTLLGVTFGRRVFGIFELGLGTDYAGCMAGIGYRF